MLGSSIGEKIDFDLGELLTQELPKTKKDKPLSVQQAELERELEEHGFVRFLRKPSLSVVGKTAEDLARLSDEYFNACFTAKIRPTVTGYALAIGLASVSSIERLGQRRPDLRYILGRSLLIIQHGYESQLGFGNPAGLMFALKNIPDGFDVDDPEGTPSPFFWQDRKQVDLTFNGVIGIKDLEKDVTPEEAYARIIKGEAVRLPEDSEDLENQEPSESSESSESSDSPESKESQKLPESPSENTRPSWLDVNDRDRLEKP